MADVGTEMCHREHILERLEQAIQKRFRGRTQLERLPTHDALELSMFGTNPDLVIGEIKIADLKGDQLLTA